MLLGKYLEYIYPLSDKTFLIKHGPWFKPRDILLFSKSLTRPWRSLCGPYFHGPLCCSTWTGQAIMHWGQAIYLCPDRDFCATSCNTRSHGPCNALHGWNWLNSCDSNLAPRVDENSSTLKYQFEGLHGFPSSYLVGFTRICSIYQYIIYTYIYIYAHIYIHIIIKIMYK